MKNKISIFFFLACSFVLQAQDFHSSQSDWKMSMQNPATVGSMEFDQKISATYRSQWSAIPDAYRNIGVAYEQKISAFSWGANILHNDAGESSLKTSQVLLNLSYQKRLSGLKDFLAIGGSGGFIQQRFNPELFSFDNQYIEGEGFDSNLSNGENFSKTTQVLYTATVGVFLSKYFNRIKSQTGLSFSHLNKPKIQFNEIESGNYPMHISFFSNAQVPIRKDIKATFLFIWNKQSHANERIFGAKLRYQLNSKNAITGGVSNRLNDAWILETGFIFPNSSFVVSYDMNNSVLSSATNSRGAWELSASYFFNKKKKSIQPSNINLSINDTKSSEKDSDGDGVFDNVDECPYTPGLRHFNGCNDTDRDGVWDSKDACPHLFGEKTNQGCPVSKKDSDKDGLLDDVDKCPFLKGSVAMNGCPDSDKDGISDMEDYCPFLKGEKETNGCPKMNKEEHELFLEKKSVNTIVEFDTDKSIVKNHFYQELDEVIAFVLQNPKAKVFITGHTDNEGEQEFNFRLGQRRAQAVARYFIQRGVAFHQISTISYGETMHVRRNNDEYGRIKNRRVEVHVIVE